MADRLLLLLATLGPVGRLPAPGTMGSLAALAAAPWLFFPLPLAGRLAVLAGLFCLGALAAGRAEALLHRKDPGCVVIDEVLGQWLACLFLAAPDWPEILAALALFRLLDIAKPWPVRAAETWLPGGQGVMLDDAVAGLLAAALLALA